MRIAVVAPDLCPHHSVADILDLPDVGTLELVKESRPAATTVELGLGREQRNATD